MSDDAPKSAYELAMERLRKQDAKSGEEQRPLDDEQRAAIAEARRVAEAKLAEREILYHSARRGVADPEALQALEDDYRRDRERIVSHRDRKLEEIRKR